MVILGSLEAFAKEDHSPECRAVKLMCFSAWPRLRLRHALCISGVTECCSTISSPSIPRYDRNHTMPAATQLNYILFWLGKDTTSHVSSPIAPRSVAFLCLKKGNSKNVIHIRYRNLGPSFVLVELGKKHLNSVRYLKKTVLLLTQTQTDTVL